MYFSGHGYISASMVARMDEKTGWYEHFPWLKIQREGISYIDHSQQDDVKFLLMVVFTKDLAMSTKPVSQVNHVKSERKLVPKFLQVLS